jgi:putative PIN family toxin of toxin-antitoxin system
MRSIVVDTNVLVAALLTPFGAPARVLDTVLAGQVRLLYDDRILTEYGEVLARAKSGFDPGDVADLLAFLRSEGQGVAAPSLGLPVLNPDDAMFIEVALAGNGDALVAGNRGHFPPDACRVVPVLSPVEFLASLRA